MFTAVALANSGVIPTLEPGQTDVGLSHPGHDRMYQRGMDNIRQASRDVGANHRS